jgi:hypothetical protein
MAAIPAHAQSQVNAMLPGVLSTLGSGIAAGMSHRNAAIAAGLGSASGNLAGQLINGQVQAVPLATGAVGAAAGAAIAGPRYASVGAVVGNLGGAVVGNMITAPSRDEEAMRQQGAQIQAGMGNAQNANFVVVQPGVNPLDARTDATLRTALGNLEKADAAYDKAAARAAEAEDVLGAAGMQARAVAGTEVTRRAQIAIAYAVDFNRVLNNASMRGFDTRGYMAIAAPAAGHAISAAMVRPNQPRTVAYTYTR